MRNSIIKNLFIICFISISCFAQAQETGKRAYTVNVNSKTGETTMTKEELKAATIGISNPQSSGKVLVKRFTLKCPGKKAIFVNGDKMSDEAIQGIMNTRAGDYITVYDPTFQEDGKDETSNITSVSILLK